MSVTSLLLKNLNTSCRYLSHAYSAEGREFPRDEGTIDGGLKAIQFLGEELGIGIDALTRWRDHQVTKHTMSAGRNAKWIQSCTAECPNDTLLLTACIEDLRSVVSPFVALRKAGTSVSGGSEFVAARDIPAGMFLMSVPTDGALTSNAPMSSDANQALDHHMHIDDIAAQLMLSLDDPIDPFHRYAHYLLDNVVPPRNLPFLKRSDVESADATPIWDFFHTSMKGQPLNPLLADKLTPEEYSWYVSTVMSRRSGSSTMIPLIDKLNHSHQPNAYFTMATEATFCGIDLIDNMVAGVDADLIFTPYIHVFAIDTMRAGTPLTISYSDAPPTRPDGRDTWRLSWGFVPSEPSVYTEQELKTVANIVAAHRVDNLRRQFPLRNPA